MSRKIPRYSREWLIEALKLSLSSLDRGENETAVARRLYRALQGFLLTKREK